MKTSAQIAKDLGLTKAQVYQYLHRNNIKPAQKKGNKYYYSDKAFQSVSKHFKIASHSSKSTSKSYDGNQNNSLAIKALMKQLEEKDKQIEKLTKLLDQQQQLNLLSANKSHKAIQSDLKQESKGFWYKLFH